MAVRLEAPLRQELRFPLLRGDQPDHILVEAGRHRLLLDVGDESVLILALDEVGELFRIRSHSKYPSSIKRARSTGDCGGPEAGLQVGWRQRLAQLLQVGERHALEGLADAQVDPLPCAADPTI